MKIAEVKKLTPLEIFDYWVSERQEIYLKRLNAVSKPWTDDEILMKFKFCNVLRINDRVSQWLLENWYQPNFDHANMPTAVTLARQLNNTESLADVGFPKKWSPAAVQKILDKRVVNGLKNFAAAYMITGTLGGTKIEQVVHKVVTPIHADRSKLIDRSSMKTTWENLLPYAGFSSFIAGQVVADLRWTVDVEWPDKDEWAPMGPGSKRGMNRILGRKLGAPISKGEFQKELAKLIDRVRSSRNWLQLPEAIDVQNCLCETDKYLRTLNGEGRPKQRFAGV